MILPLQKRHRLVWSVLAILLPIGFISAYMAIQEVPVNMTEEEKLYSAEKPFGEREDEFFKITEEESTFEGSIINILIIEIKKPINQAATVIYISETDQIDNQKAIGQLDKTGTYIFMLQDPLQTNDNILFYNPIHKEVFHILKSQE